MVSSIVYSGDGTTRIFPVDFKILGENFVRVYVDGVEVTDKRKYDIINNSIVFNEEETPQIGQDNITILIATSESELGDLGAPITDIMIVAQNIADINAVGQQVVPNLPEILLADDNATIATQKALEASNSATSASESATIATTKAGEALTSANNASTSEANALAYRDTASTHATTASTQAGIATTKAEEASASASASLTSRNQAEAFAQQAQLSAESVDANNLVPEMSWGKPPSRRNNPLFTKVNPHSISIPSGFKVAVNNKVISLASDYILSLDLDLDTGTKTAGKDYYVYAKSDGTFYLSADNSITTDRLIGGFHYGLTPENEVLPTGALKTEADMVANRGIKSYSMWDLTWRPAAPRPEGKVLVNNLFWRDIYPADEDYAIRGYSSCFALDGVTPAKLAGGDETHGRKFPKIPLSKGGDGTINYGSLTWYEANEIVSDVGMRMISYDEFSNSSYGVVEQKSLKDLGYPLGTGIIQHYPELESKWGVEMAVGVQYYCGGQILNGRGSTDLARRTGLTDGRGSVYATSNSPVATRLGGHELGTSTYYDHVSGSRYLGLHSYVGSSYWSLGFVAVCDHVNLDK